MTPDDDLPEHLRSDRDDFERFFTGPLSPTRWITGELHNAHRIPEGAALIVGNHGPLGLDTPVLVHSIFANRGRVPRALADRLFYTNPIGRYVARMTASVEGRPENARSLLEAGEWVIVYPGGARETQRSEEARYTLSWEGRTGFVRLAMRTGVPVVPVACIGNDDLFIQVRSRDEMAQTLPGRMVRRWIGEHYVTPLLVPSPRKARFRYFVGDAIDLQPGDPADQGLVRENQQVVKRALEALMEQGLETVADGQPEGRPGEVTLRDEPASDSSKSMDREPIETDRAPAAIGPYSQAIRAGDLVFLSGQIALDPATGELVGEGDVVAQTERVLDNLEAVLEASGASWGSVVKATIFLTDLGDFGKVNECYAKRFEGLVPPARACVEVSRLPKGVDVEIEAIAML